MSQTGSYATSGVTPPSGAILQINGDTGSANPDIGGVVDIVGSTNIRTVASGNTLEIFLEDDVVISGDYTTTAGNINLPTTLSSGLEGVITINSIAFIQNLGSNIIIGKNAGNFTFNTGSAINNTIIGEGSFGGLTTGANNTIIGEDTMLSATSASINTAVGASALAGITSGTGNLALGAGAGSALLSTESNNILIGNPGVVSDSNTIRIGVDGNGALEQDTCFIAGIIGNTVSNTELVTIDSTTGQLGTTAIDLFVDSFAADVGTATPVSGLINVVGGSNVNTSAASNTITINATSTNSFINWQTINSTVTLAAGNGYFIDMSVAGFSVNLPTTSNVGDTYILAISASNSPTLNRSVTINQNSGQSIFVTAASQAKPTTTGVGGSLAINTGWITLVCNVANTTFVAMSGDATPTIV